MSTGARFVVTVPTLATALILSMAALAALYKNTPAAKALAATVKGILVLPNIVRAGFIVGAQYGEGDLLKDGKIDGYYMPQLHTVCRSARRSAPSTSARSPCSGSTATAMFDSLMLSGPAVPGVPARPARRSHAGAVGVMPVMTKTGQEMQVGDIRQLAAFASYNAGPARTCAVAAPTWQTGVAGD